MKSVMYKVLSILLAALTVVCLIAAFTVKGSGIIDMSGIVKYLLIGVAAICGIGAAALLVAAKKKR